MRKTKENSVIVVLDYNIWHVTKGGQEERCCKGDILAKIRL